MIPEPASPTGSAPVGPPAPGRMLVRGTIFTLIGHGLQFLVLILTIPWLVRHLGNDRFGVFNLTVIMISYLTLMDLALGRSVVRFASEATARGQADRIGPVFWMAWRVVGFLAVGGGIALFVAAPFLAQSVFRIPVELIPEAEICFRFAAISSCCWVLNQPLAGVLEASGRFDIVSAVRSPSVMLTQLIPVAVVGSGGGLAAAMAAVAAKDLVSTIALYFSARQWVPALRRISAWAPELLPDLFRFGAWKVILLAAPVLVATLDRLVIGAWVGTGTVTLFAVPQQIVNSVLFIPFSITLVASPAVSRLIVADPVKLRELHRRTMDLVVVGMVPLCALLFLGAREILETWVGPGFRTSVPVLCLLCGTLLLFSIRLVASSVLTETRFVRAGVLITAVYLALHFGLSVLWLPTWGVVGPAMSSVLSQAIGLVLTLLVVIRLGILDIRSLISSRVLVLTIAALLATTLLALGKGGLAPWPWILLAIAAGAIYALTAWRWALPASIRASLLGGLR